MKTILFTIIIIFSVSNLKAQNIPDCIKDSAYKPAGSHLLKLVDDEILKNYDFQLRFWPGGKGFYRNPTVELLVISYKQNKWTAKVYSFITGGRNSPPHQKTEIITKNLPTLNYDSIYKLLIADSLCYIRSMDGEEALSRGYNKTGIPISIAEGGTIVTIELLGSSKGKKISYDSPQNYYEAYELQELKQPVKIINTLMRIMGYNIPQ